MPGRLVVVDQVYHQPEEGDVVTNSVKFSQLCSTTEQAFGPRRVKLLDNTWQPLEVGWLKDCSLMVLENVPNRRSTNPTPEEAALDAEAVLDVLLLREGDNPNRFTDAPTPHLVIRLNQGHHFLPYLLPGIWVRCRKGTTNYIVTIYPV